MSDFTTLITSDRMPFGKYSGKLYRDINTGYLLWAAKNLSFKRVRTLCKRELDRRRGTTRVHADRNPRTHYEWADIFGATHWIPKDVDMAGRELEPCPFDTVDELDREFAEIVR